MKKRFLGWNVPFISGENSNSISPLVRLKKSKTGVVPVIKKSVYHMRNLTLSLNQLFSFDSCENPQSKYSYSI